MPDDDKKAEEKLAKALKKEANRQPIRGGLSRIQKATGADKKSGKK